MSQHFIAVSSARSALNALLRQPKGDFGERIGSQFTVGVLTLLAAVLLTSHYWGEPIQCWVRIGFSYLIKYFVEFRCPPSTHRFGCSL
jgi:hypothetical protein